MSTSTPIVIEAWNCQCGHNCCQKYAEGLIGVVFNVCYGGFSLSNEAVKLIDMDSDDDDLYSDKIRVNWKLVKAVCLLADKVNGHFAKLKVKWINAKYLNHYEIDEYDGSESIRIRESDYLISQIKTMMDVDTDDDDDDKLLDMIRNLKLKTHDEPFNTVKGDGL